MAQKEIFEKKFNGGWKKVITKAPYKDGFRTDPYLYTPDGKKLRSNNELYNYIINNEKYWEIFDPLKIHVERTTEDLQKPSFGTSKLMAFLDLVRSGLSGNEAKMQMNSMENQSKTTSKPGPLCSKRAVVNMENEGDLEIQKESFTPSNGSSYNRKLGIFTNKSTSSEGSECNRCKKPAEVKCTNPTCAQMKKEYLCRRCDIAYHNPSYVSRDGHKRVSITEAGSNSVLTPETVNNQKNPTITNTKDLKFDAAPMADGDKHLPSKIYEKLNGKICKQCGYDGPVRFDTIRHIRNVHLKTKFWTCNKCNFESKLLNELKKHFDDTHAKHSVTVAFTPAAPEVLTHAQLTQTVQEVQKNHPEIQKNNPEGRKIPEMQQKHSKVSEQIPDNDKHIPQKIYEKLNGKNCKECGFTGLQRSLTIQHILNTHLDSKLFQCNKCNFEHEKMVQLKFHFNTIHGKKSDDEIEKIPEKNNITPNIEKKKEDSGFLEEDLDIVIDNKITDKDNEKKSPPSLSKFGNSHQNQQKPYKPKWFRDLQDPTNPQIVKVVRPDNTANAQNTTITEGKNKENAQDFLIPDEIYEKSSNLSQAVQNNPLSKFEISRQNQPKNIDARVHDNAKKKITPSTQNPTSRFENSRQNQPNHLTAARGVHENDMKKSSATTIQNATSRFENMIKSSPTQVQNPPPRVENSRPSQPKIMTSSSQVRSNQNGTKSNPKQQLSTSGQSINKRLISGTTLGQVKKAKKSLICKYCDEEFFWSGALDEHIEFRHEYEGEEAILGF